MKINYRPEIDGIRALAVIAVIFYHAKILLFNFDFFQGGFIGVDVFFVISGYLITSLILKELTKTGKFSFKFFYERRIRRLLPALFFVMILSFPFAWFLLLQNSFIDYSKSVLYSLGFTSNFYFHYTGIIYGSENGLFKPFLHTWSLSIEEQYYIFFPILLVILYKFLRRYIFLIIFIGFLISFLLANYITKYDSSFSFYLLPTRGWELLFGSILAYLEIKYGRPDENKTIYSAFTILGLFLIFCSFVYFRDNGYHPSYNTLIPILGVGLIIWYSQKNHLVVRFLSSKMMVGLGLISYSLYLWHYPVFAFARVIEFAEGDVFKKILLGIIIIFFSIISYFFIEKPARKKSNSYKLVFLLLASFSVLIIFTNFLVIKNNGFKERLPNILADDNYFQRPETLLKNQQGEQCHDNSDGCSFNILKERKIITVGDSHIASIIYDLKDEAIKREYQFKTSVFSQCIFFPGFDKVWKKNNVIDKNCNNDYFLRLENFLLKQRNAIIIFGGRWPVYLNKKYFDNLEGGVEGQEWESSFKNRGMYQNIEKSFKKSVEKISKHNHVILIYPIPEVGVDVPRKIYKRWLAEEYNLNHKNASKNITTSFELYQSRTKSSFELLDSIQNDNIYRVYPHKLFCNTLENGRCVTHDKKNKFYCDSNHPSLLGAEMINELIINQINIIENKNKHDASLQ